MTAYILTAAHVTKKPKYRLTVTKIDLSEGMLNPKVTTEVKEGNATLHIVVWEYNHNGRSGKMHTYPAKEVWKSNRVDASIVKITAPKIALNVATLRYPDFESLRVGDRVVRTGCPFSGPPFLVRGHIARFDVSIDDVNYDWYAIDTSQGDSGSGIFLEDTMELIAISSVKTRGACYMCGAVPIQHVVKELRETERWRFLVRRK
jgi:V8-like Glu-specific endopeptidase